MKIDQEAGLEPATLDKEFNRYDSPPSTPESVSDNGHDLDAVRAVRRKVDRRLLSFYCVAYLIMRINVTNATNTAIMNAKTPQNIKIQLGNLTSSQWAWIISIFFYPYMFFEPPSTLLLKRFTPRVWMSRIMITWGIVSMCQAATRSYSGMLACRFFLGLAEAGFYPGVLYHASFWYPSARLPLRIAVFYSFGVFSGTVSGLLAFAIGYMNKLHGLSGWQWMFILEGIPPVILGIVAWFTLPNFPSDSDSNKIASFLTESERRTLAADLPVNQPVGNAKAWDISQAKGLVSDPTFYTFNLLWIFHSIGGWGIVGPSTVPSQPDSKLIGFTVFGSPNCDLRPWHPRLSHFTAYDDANLYVSTSVKLNWDYVKNLLPLSLDSNNPSSFFSRFHC